MAASDAFYIEIRDEVNILLAELGTTYRVRGIDVYDPETMTTTSSAEREVVGIVANQMQTHGMIPNTAYLDDQAEWLSTKNLILAESSNPAKTEEVLVDGEWFPLSGITPIKPADITVVYILDVSR